RRFCNQGDQVCLVDDQYTTAHAARAELIAILAGHPTQGMPLPIHLVTKHGSAYVVELAKITPVGPTQDMHFHWVVMWVANASIRSAYSSRRESALRLCQSHNKSRCSE